MDFLRRYHDKPDWETVDEQMALSILKDAFHDTSLVLMLLKKGEAVCADNATYRLSEQDVPEAQSHTARPGD